MNEMDRIEKYNEYPLFLLEDLFSDNIINQATAKEHVKNFSDKDSLADISDTIVNSLSAITSEFVNLNNSQQFQSIIADSEKSLKTINDVVCETMKRFNDLEWQIIHDEYILKMEFQGFKACDSIVENFIFLKHQIVGQIIIESIKYLQTGKKGPNSEKIPLWFVEFISENLKKKKKARDYSPYLQFNPNTREVELIIPQKTIKELKSNNFFTFTVHTVNTENEFKIFEEQIYPDIKGIDWFSEQIEIYHIPPAEIYIINKDLSEFGLNNSINTEIAENPLFFNFHSGKLIKRDNCNQSDKLWIIAPEECEIIPDSVIMESGELYGNWYGYSYYAIDGSRDPSWKVCQISPHTPFSCELTSYPDPFFSLNNHPTYVNIIPEIVIQSNSIIQLKEFKIKIRALTTNNNLKNPVISKDLSLETVLTIQSDTKYSIELSRDTLLGPHPNGLFELLIQDGDNKIMFYHQFAILSQFNYKFSKDLYGPTDEKIQLIFQQGPDLVIDITTAGGIIKNQGSNVDFISNSRETINGTIQFSHSGNMVFTGIISFKIPELRYSLDLQDQIISTHKYLTLDEDKFEKMGIDKNLIVEFPIKQLNYPTLSTNSGSKQINPKSKNNLIFKFNISELIDNLLYSSGSKIEWILHCNNTQSNEISIPLLALERWNVTKLITNKVNIYPTLINFVLDWEENYQIPRKCFKIWHIYEGHEEVFKEEDIEPSSHSLRLTYSTTSSDGYYYIQFIRKENDITKILDKFPGDGALNTFRLGPDHSIKKCDELFYQNEYVKSLECYQKEGNIQGWIEKVKLRLIPIGDIHQLISCFENIFTNIPKIPDDIYYIITETYIHAIVKKLNNSSNKISSKDSEDFVKICSHLLNLKNPYNGIIKQFKHQILNSLITFSNPNEDLLTQLIPNSELFCHVITQYQYNKEYNQILNCFVDLFSTDCELTEYELIIVASLLVKIQRETNEVGYDLNDLNIEKFRYCADICKNFGSDYVRTILEKLDQQFI